MLKENVNTKFIVLFCSPRTGSNLVQSVLRGYVKEKWGYKTLPDSPIILNWLSHRHPLGGPYLFKCFPHNIHSKEIFYWLNNSSIFFCLERKNKLNQILSNEIANKRSEWVAAPEPGQTYHINIANLDERALTIQRYYRYKKWLSMVIKTLYYEEFENNNSNILKSLGIQDYKLEHLSDLPKKLFTNYEDVVENYGEVVDWWKAQRII